MNRDYIQFGCGTCAPSGWRNFDVGPAFWLQKYLPFSKSWLVRKGFPDYPVKNIEFADVITGLPVERNSATAVYCSHILEHLGLSEVRSTLRNVHNYLKPGGRFRLVVPDIEFIITQY
jgi:SAM-dependent methyltransferase